jgi:hypothetical protein
MDAHTAAQATPQAAPQAEPRAALEPEPQKLGGAAH